METKPTPLTIVFSLVALVLIAFFGFMSVSTGLNSWYHGESAPALTTLIGRTIIYVLVPFLAIIDIGRHRSAGRYIALLTLVSTAAMLFRAFLDGALLPVRGSAIEGFITMFCFSMSMIMIALTLGLAFTPNADSWFEQLDESPNELPAPMPIESVIPTAGVPELMGRWDQKDTSSIKAFRDIRVV